MDKITKIAAFGSTPYWAEGLELRAGGISGGLELALLGIQTTRDIALDFAEVVARIDGDDTLSTKGKHGERRE